MRNPQLVDLDISEEMANVTHFPPLPDDKKLERLAEIHREKAHNAEQNMSEIRRNMKDEAAAFEADDIAAEARYQAEKAERAANAAASKAKNELLLAGKKRIASYNRAAERAALDALAE